MRDAGGLATHRNLRGAITPTPRQQGIDTAPSPVSSRWAWAHLLKRVFVLDRERCPRGQLDRLRILAALTCRPVIFRILALSPEPSPA